MFKFLRPGSRKQQTRSISTPVLSVKSPSLMYDGPSDDPALLTVQYELSEHPQHNMRSLSTSQLGNAHAPGTNNQPPSSGLLHRSPTFAEYERNLSVMGDDRRRPSSMNLTRLHEIHEEDRKESVGIRKKLSRAKELKDDVSPLMAQALSKHQREKDLFRSSSKRHEAERAHRPTPVFSAPTFSHTGSSLAPTPEDHSELLDPLEKGELVGGAQYPHGGNFLSPMAAAGLSSRASAAASLGGPSTTASSYQLGAASAESRPTKIGTSLASWSKYPSHTRFERCGSAGRLDNVTTKDFALIDPENVQASDEDEPEGSPTSQANKSHAKPGKKLAKSRSLTFSGIVRYYSNLFHTSGFTGQNRRTSVTVGGRLEHPELEMLAPQAPDDHQHSHEHIKHLKDIVKEDAEKVAEYVRDEENKLEGYIRKEEEELEQFVRMEEGKIEDFVREEEDKFEGFVRKEEGKLKKFVHEEEDKWMHYQHAGPASSNAPFRTGSIFAAPNSNDHGHRHIEDGMIRPTKRPNASDLEASGGLRLDGTATAASAQAAVPPSAPSKAELWSNMYQDCVARPPSAGVAEAAQLPSRCESMPPPALKPMKARSPEQPKERDAHAKIRRFPSVTVVDDQKGHFRSVSLISVKTSRSTGFEKSSAHDLLELVREREEQEREKLLKGCGGDIME